MPGADDALESDLLPILMRPRPARSTRSRPEWRDAPALTVVLASKGYPGAYDKNTPIRALPTDDAGSKVFHAGTALKDGQLVATGGRVLNVTAVGATVAEAQKARLSALDQVEWDNGFCRRDIGWREVAREAE
jgi:phosphoribosylamine--glycine ligase